MKKRYFIGLLFFIISNFTFAMENNFFLEFNESDFEVNSFLIEGKTEYSKKNLSSNDELPWVPKNSENAYIIINNCDTKDIVISSGYVSKDRPDLFAKNARPKILFIEYLNSKKNKNIELKDTPEPQIINIFSPKDESEPIKISFVEKYNGNKYSDLCINYICKAVCKRNPTNSINTNELIFEENRSSSSFMDSFYDKNVKIIINKDILLIYNNNNFPEVKFNNFILNLDISMQYSEAFGIKQINDKEYEIILSCDDTKEYFTFDKESFIIEKKNTVKYSYKE